MGWWSKNVLGVPDGKPSVDGSEARALESGLSAPSDWLSDSLGGSLTPAGKRVTVVSAMGLAPVWAAVSIISEQVGQLPFKVYKDVDGNKVQAGQHRAWRLLHDKPNEHTPADRFWSAVTAQLLLWGNVFIEKRRDADGLVDQLFLLDPSLVMVEWSRERSIKRFVYEDPSAGAAGGQRRRVFSSDDVLHIHGMSLDGVVGLSIISQCRSALGAAMAREEFEGGFYRRGTVLSGFIKHPGKVGVEALHHLSSSFKAIYQGGEKAHGTPVFEEGSEFVAIQSPLRDLQFVESQAMSRTDIAVMFKLPPNYLGGSSGDGLTYATVEANQIQFALHAIAPVTNTIAKAISNDAGILPQGVHTAEFVLEAMMRGDAADRSAFYEKMVGIGAMHPDEVRARENLPALTAAQKRDLKPEPPPAPVLPATPEPPSLNGSPGPVPMPGRN